MITAKKSKKIRKNRKKAEKLVFLTKKRAIFNFFSKFFIPSHLGVGVAIDPESKKAICVCQYEPSGNFGHKFLTNVLPTQEEAEKIRLQSVTSVDTESSEIERPKLKKEKSRIKNKSVKEAENANNNNK